MNFSAHVLGVFSDNKTTYTEFKNLMNDYCNNTLDGISKAEAKDKIHEISLQIFGLTADTVKNAKLRRRAVRDHHTEFFDVIEEVEDFRITVGLQENEIFNQYVEYRNLALGDRETFWTNDETFLTVAKLSGDHHDLSLQKLGKGQSYTVATSKYGAKVGTDINRYLLGQVDFNEMITKLEEAFVRKIQETLYAEIVGAAKKLPVTTGFIGTGKLDTTTKEEFDNIIINTRMANDNADVMIIGTERAVRKLNNLVVGGAINWASEGIKNSIADTGRLGSYEGTNIIVMPNRFEDRTLTTTVFDDKVLTIVPLVNDETNKPVKMIDVGDTEIHTVDDKAELMDDFKTYEVQRGFGIGTKITRQFGQWTIAE